MWTKLTNREYFDRKWELRHNNIVLATIFRKPAPPGMPEKYSLYVSSPKVYAKYLETCKTHLFDSFEEACEAFDRLSAEQVLPWAEAVVDYFKNKTSPEVV